MGLLVSSGTQQTTDQRQDDGPSAFQRLATAAMDAVMDPRGGVPPETVLAAREDPRAAAQVKEVIAGVVRQAHYAAQTRGEPFLDGMSPEEATEKIFKLFFGLGPIGEILNLPDVEDIAINGPNNWWIRIPTGWQQIAPPEEFRGAPPETLLLMLNHSIKHTGKQASRRQPIVDAHLQGGHRLSLVTAPAIDEGDAYPVAVVRRHRPRSFTVMDFLTQPVKPVPRPPLGVPAETYLREWRQSSAPEHTLWTPAMAAFFHMAVLAQLNIMVIGVTGTGKTSTIGALLNLIPIDRRIIILEDTREIRLRDSERRNVAYYTSVRESGDVEVTLADLVKVALRQRPDHLVVGEARGAEITEVIKAIQTGHGGNITSVHAISVEDTILRIHGMYQESEVVSIQRMDESQVAKALARSFHLFMVTRMSHDGRRYVETVAALTGEVAHGAPVLETIFHNTLAPEWRAELQTDRLPPRLMRELERFGLDFQVVVDVEQRQGV